LTARLASREALESSRATPTAALFDTNSGIIRATIDHSG